MVEPAPEGQAEPPSGDQYPARFEQGRLAALPDPVEAGGRVEGGTGEGQGEHVTHAEVAFRRAGAGDGHEAFRGVDARNGCATLTCQVRGEARPAGDVQQPRAIGDGEPVEDHLVGRSGVGLPQVRPVGCLGSPGLPRLLPVVARAGAPGPWWISLDERSYSTFWTIVRLASNGESRGARAHGGRTATIDQADPGAGGPDAGPDRGARGAPGDRRGPRTAVDRPAGGGHRRGQEQRPCPLRLKGGAAVGHRQRGPGELHCRGRRTHARRDLDGS